MKYRHHGHANRHARKQAKLAQRRVRAIASDIAWEETLGQILEEDRRQQLILEAQDAIVAAQLEQDAEFLGEVLQDRAFDQSMMFQ